MIPDTVTAIGSHAFERCTSISSVIIPGSVESIGIWAFYSCASLESITIPTSVTAIEAYAFSRCTSLASAEIPGTVESVMPNTFSYCTGLTAMTIGDGVGSIGNAAFYGCSKLTSVTIPGSVMSIGNYAFGSCTSLQSLNVPDTVTSIGSYTFRYCTSLSSFTIPDAVTSVGRSVFYGCTSLTSVVIPDTVKDIGDSAFYGCSKLASVTIPGSAESIGDSAFYGCTSLASVTIPVSVQAIGDSAFYGCTSLDTVYYNASGLDTSDSCWPDSGDILFIDANGGYVTGGAMGSQKQFPPSDSYVSPAGKRFEEYNTGADGKGTSHTPGEPYSLTGKQTVYAIWKALPPYTVTFDANGGSCDTGSLVTGTDGKLPSLPTAARDGFSFDGWFTLAEGGEKITTSYEFSEDATVYAHWTVVTVTYTITFDANGGSCGTVSLETGPDGRLPSLPTATREGYAFTGWYTLAESGDRVSTSYVFSDDATVYAHWGGSPGPTPSSGGGIPAAAVIGVAIAVIAAAGAIVLFVRRR